MLHPNSRLLIDEWRSRRNGARLPLRTALSPAAFGPVLPQIFVLGLDAGVDRVRLAGGLLADLHGRELRGLDFTSLWSGLDRQAIRDALADARRYACPMLLRAEGITLDGAAIGIEAPLCPLIGPTDQADRTIGLYQPTSLTSRLGGHPIERLRLTSVEPCSETGPVFAAAIGAEDLQPPRRGVSARAALKLVVDNTRRVA